MSRKFFLILVAAIGGVAVSPWAWWQLSEMIPESHPVLAARNDATDPDQPGIAVSPQERARAGIGVSAIELVELQGEMSAIATALSIQDLADAASTMAAAQAQADRAAAALVASKRDFERLRNLHEQDRNVSDRALEVAEAAWRADDANARASETALAAMRANVRARWSQEIAVSISQRGPLWGRLMAGRSVLLRVVPEAGDGVEPMPASIKVATPGGVFRTARLISRAPAADPRIQRGAFFYEAGAEGILSGMTLSASVGTGRQEVGARLPINALLWWQGKRWVYVETSSGRFERREVISGRRIEDGWFVPGFVGGAVVSSGAQALLSQELQSSNTAGKEEK